MKIGPTDPESADDRKDKSREGEAPAEPPLNAPDARLRGSVALPSLAANHRKTDVILPKRHHPAHGIKYVDGQPTIIFDTLCLKHRSPLLACDAFHAVFREVAKNATAWLMGRYVIMPDHIHFFASDAGNGIPYENWVQYLKSQITKQYAGRRSTPGGRRFRGAASYPQVPAPQERRPPAFRWPTDHWDTRVRTATAYEEKWRYVLENPVRKGLVAKSEDWPYQGQIFDLRWD